MSSEIERLNQSGRRMMLFWLIITCCSLTYCLVGAFSDQPQMIHTWRGWALLGLAGFFLLWYGSWCWRGFRERRWSTRVWPPPWREAARRWGLIFGLTVLMTALHPLMGWLFWAAFGASFGLFGRPWLILPASLSSLGIFYTLIATTNPPPDAIIWIILSLGLSTLTVGYSLYLMSRFLHERYEREQVFTQLEDAHRQLAEAHRQLEHSAEREAELAVLSERNRLAREMHDTIGHALVLMTVKLEAAQRLRPVNPERADHEIEATKEITRSTMTELRASLADLRSPVCEQPPLGETLARQARESGARAGFQVISQMQPDLGELSQPLYEALYRVGSEALTNIEKHARARQVALRLAREQEAIRLTIEDDGIGLPTLVTAGNRSSGTMTARPTSPPGHYGITGMRERVEALGGRFTLGPRPGGGTVVEASLPTGGS